MRPGKTGERARRATPSRIGAKKGAGEPQALVESAAGEEDPGASLDDPAMQAAMRDEARAADHPAENEAAEQSGATLADVPKSYRNPRR